MKKLAKSEQFTGLDWKNKQGKAGSVIPFAFQEIDEEKKNPIPVEASPEKDEIYFLDEKSENYSSQRGLKESSMKQSSSSIQIA